MSKKMEENIMQMIENQTDCCPFCGQFVMGKECNCPESIEDKNRKKKIAQALDGTLPLLTEEANCKKFGFPPIVDDAVLELICLSIQYVGEGRVIKAHIKVDDETTFTIQDKPTFIEISRKENASKTIKLGG